ncbi:hypothetical protein [Streptomyces sp. NPDC046182]|uniref:hypothetical protein n=1 Tax=Streptomyces sp. NPDC046182 TaxID=3154601 RepID=UPI0033BFEA00
MYAAVVDFRTDGQVEAVLDSALVTDAFWSHAHRDDGLEHVRIAVSPNGLSAAVFIAAVDAHAAAEAALALAWRLVTAVPALAGWYVESCAVLSNSARSGDPGKPGGPGGSDTGTGAGDGTR